MAGNGPAPSSTRRRRNVPLRGEWAATPGVGWQEGPVPDPPTGLCASAEAAWTAWMRSWVASHWRVEDLPALRIMVQLYDQCERAFADPYIEKRARKRADADTEAETVFVLRPNPTAELRQYMDNCGISRKGQQDRRWSPPKAEEQAATATAANTPSRYANLKVV